MPATVQKQISAIEVVCPGDPWDETLDFFTRHLAFRIEMIRPADKPDTVRLSGAGLQLLLVRGYQVAPQLVIHYQEPQQIFGEKGYLDAPNGMRIFAVTRGERVNNLVNPQEGLPDIETPAFEISHLQQSSDWGQGRAGMLYRDLIPSRVGGKFIASQIKIPQGGPVPDYVHYHQVRFQIIYCYKGWVRVLYEDQGPSLVLEEGDCILQPPTIRHQVLECSDGLEVIEIGAPAVHETYVAHGFNLPNPQLNPERWFQDQQFVCHIARAAPLVDWQIEGFLCRDTGIGRATRGVGAVQVISVKDIQASGHFRHQGEFAFVFLLTGELTLINGLDGSSHILKPGSACVLPAEVDNGLLHPSPDLQFLLVTLPEQKRGNS